MLHPDLEAEARHRIEVSMDLEIIGKVIEVLMGGGDFSFPGG